MNTFFYPQVGLFVVVKLMCVWILKSDSWSQIKEFAALLFQAIFKQHDVRPGSKPIEPLLYWLVKHFLKCMNEIKPSSDLCRIAKWWNYVFKRRPFHVRHYDRAQTDTFFKAYSLVFLFSFRKLTKCLWNIYY